MAKKKRTSKQVVLLEMVERWILLVRAQKVMLSTHLAELYEVEPRALVQAIKRKNGFPRTSCSN
jgi:hypothetical protein